MCWGCAMVIGTYMPIDKYLADLISPLLTRPEEMQITETIDDMGILLTVVVAPEDMGPLIGKAGETAKAIRHLARIVGVKNTKRVSVKINEPDGTPYVPKRKESDRDLVGRNA